MHDFFNQLKEDVRFVEGLKACMNCGVCTAICPAAAFYNYDPRIIVDTVQTRDNKKIGDLLSSDVIWYCGECMSCKTRCPRDNTPGLIIMALRSLSQELGYFVESEKGRQQLAIKRTVGETILKQGYCIYLDMVDPSLHPEQGPVWEWYFANKEKILEKIGANYKGSGPGVLRKIPSETLDELKRIFDVTGGTARFDKIEKFSKDKAFEMNKELNDKGIDNDYVRHVYTVNNNKHNR